MSSQDPISTAQRTTETELSDATPEATPSTAVKPEPTWSQVAPPANATPSPGLLGDHATDRPEAAPAAPGAEGIKAQVIRTTPDQPQPAKSTANQADPGETQVTPGYSGQHDAGTAQTAGTDANPGAPGKTQVVQGKANQADAGGTQTVPNTANQADPGETQVVSSGANQAEPDKTQVVPRSANDADPGRTQVVPGNDAGSTETTQVIPKITDEPKTPAEPAAQPPHVAPGNNAESTETTQIIPKITDEPKTPAEPAAQPQAGPAAPQPVQGGPAMTGPQGGPQPGKPHGELPKFPPAPAKPANQMFPPGVPVQMYAQNHAPHAATAVPAQPARPPKPARQRVGTTSPSGLVVGLLGVLISAVLTYAFDLIPAADGFQLSFSLGKAGQLLGNLGKIGDFPLWQAPLAVLLPLLPVVQLVLVIVLCLPRTRLVGRRLMSTARLAWIIALAVIAGYQIIVAVASASDGGTLALLGLFLVGNLIVLVALLFPHWPRDEAAPHPARR